MGKTKIGIIGGSGGYGLTGLSDVETVEVPTPFGPTSSPITVGRVGDAELMYLARHGEGHTLLPSEVNGRGNIWALKKLGVTWCIGLTACGSLVEAVRPGQLVVPDQLIDRTQGRSSTFFGRGLVMHVAFGDPFCPVLRRALIAAAREVDAAPTDEGFVHDSGTLVVMEGPAFSTRAESRMNRALGGTLIGMTVMPEAKLAREAEMSYAALALVSDYDCWHEDRDVSVPEIFETLGRCAARAKEVVLAAEKRLAGEIQPEVIKNALATSLHTRKERVPRTVVRDLEPIIGRYFSEEEKW